MSDRTFKLMIATPTGWVARSDAESVIAPGSEGYLGILPNHAPLMTALTIGMLQFRDNSGYDHTLAVTEGFLEVSSNTVTIIADTAELVEEIDCERAKKALERAKERLGRASSDPSIDVERARAAIRRALNRIRCAEGQVKLK